jgi:hypothetical protein
LKSSLDLRLDMEQQHVAMAVDMAIAEKSEVFIGNGVSLIALLQIKGRVLIVIHSSQVLHLISSHCGWRKGSILPLRGSCDFGTYYVIFTPIFSTDMTTHVCV